MDEIPNSEQAVELLQQLGLKEYEARTFVALTRLPPATAKEISDVSDVPRTRVYDAVRVLESKGLVEIQHASPQRFRAVPIAEAVETLQASFVSRTEQLRETLETLEPAESEESEIVQEIWSLSGTDATATRTDNLLDEATREVVLVVGDASVVTDALTDRLVAATERGVDVFLGTVDEGVAERVRTTVPDARVFVSGLEWLQDAPEGEEADIGRILLVDRNTILVSTLKNGGRDPIEEQAVFGRGFENGVVAVFRRLMATGLLTSDTEAI